MGIQHTMQNILRVNRALVPIKLHYALLNGGTAPVMPAMPVYSKVLRFSGFVVGTIYTVLPLVALVLRPIFCAIADKWKCHRAVLMTWLLLMMTCYFSVQFIPIPDGPAANSTKIQTTSKISQPKFYNILLCSSKSSPHFEVEGAKFDWECHLSQDLCNYFSRDHIGICQNLTVTSHSKAQQWCQPLGQVPAEIVQKHCQAAYQYKDTTGEQDNATTFGQWQFWLFLLLLIGTISANSIITTISDTVCIEICGDASLYGKQRLWGSIAWGIFSIANGLIVDAFSTDGGEKNYTPAFYLMLLPLLIDVVVFYFIKFEIPQQSRHIASDVWTVLLTPRSIVFMFWCAMVGVSFGMIGGFLYWFLESLADNMTDPSAANSIKTIEGLVMGIETLLGETPAFFFGGWIVEKLGHGHSFSLILLIIGVRFSLYSILVNPWWSLPIEVLHNYYGIFYSTMTSYAKTIAEPGTEATIQSILAAICEGIGMAAGSFIGGVIIDAHGGATLFKVFGIAYLVMAVLNEGIEYLFRRSACKKQDAEKLTILRNSR